MLQLQVLLQGQAGLRGQWVIGAQHAQVAIVGQALLVQLGGGDQRDIQAKIESVGGQLLGQLVPRHIIGFDTDARRQCLQALQQRR